jgi:hypothetical protein
MTTTVTVTVDSPRGHLEIIRRSEGMFVLPTLFSAMRAAVSGYEDEIPVITSAMKLLGDALAAATSTEDGTR